MSEWYDSQNQSSINFRKLLQVRIEKANPRCELTNEEAKRLVKLEAIAEKLKRGENVQNRSLKTQDTRKELRV
jgi:hypothetical protein